MATTARHSGKTIAAMLERVDVLSGEIVEAAAVVAEVALQIGRARRELATAKLIVAELVKETRKGKKGKQYENH